MAARFPVAAANSVAAATFGPIEPAGRSMRIELDRGRPVDPHLGRLPEVAIDAVHVGRHHEEVRLELARQQAGREVLVDDRLDTHELAVDVPGVHRRDPPAAGADDHRALLQEPAHRADLEDPLRPRRRDHPPPVWPVGLDVPTLLARERLRGGLVVDRPHELGRVVERRIVGIDLDHRQEGRKGPIEREEVADLLLDHIADHPLGLSAEDVEWIGIDVLVGGSLQCEQADLRPVSVRDDELMVGRHAGEGGRRDPHVGALPPGGHRLTRASAGRCHRGR